MPHSMGTSRRSQRSGIESLFTVPLTLAMLDECTVLVFLEGEL